MQLFSFFLPRSVLPFPRVRRRRQGSPGWCYGPLRIPALREKNQEQPADHVPV